MILVLLILILLVLVPLVEMLQPHEPALVDSVSDFRQQVGDYGKLDDDHSANNLQRRRCHRILPQPPTGIVAATLMTPRRAFG
jgi:hypothetical protein